MNSKKFSEAMSELDSKYVDEAINYKKKAKKPVWIKWGAMSACLCFIVVAITIVPSMLSPQESEGGGGGTIVDGGTSSGGGESEVGGNEKATFQATILEIHDGYYLVEPVDGSTELNSADQITVPITNMDSSQEPEKGDVLEIVYDGAISESYPGQITNVYSISIVECSQNILQEPPTFFAKQSVIDAIEQDITDQDIGSWTETANATLDLEYVIPIYSTANVAKDSHTILDILVFDNQYMIPVMSNDECIGTITVVQQENKWVIFVYEHGFDLKTAVNNKETATCVVEVIQLNGRGFLISSDTEEFVPISGFGISDNMSGEELLNRILENTGISNDTDG